MSKSDSKNELPELPEGYFWRVTSHQILDYVRVELRKEAAHASWWSLGLRKTKTSDLISARWVLRNSGEKLPRAISRTAAFIREDWEQVMTLRQDMKNCLGDYPPKKLEA